MTTADSPRRGPMSHKPLAIAAAVALLVAAIASAAILLSRKSETGPGSVDIAVVGDAYSSGRANRVVWPTLLSQRTGWSVANFALPGTGFAADGEGGWAFTYQVDRALQAQPKTVLIVGGLDDGGYVGTGNIGQGATDALNKIIRAGKRALVIGPTWYETPVPPSIVDGANEIKDAANQAGVPYLNALDPPWLTKGQMMPDQSGPTDDGQSVLADKIAAWLHSEIPA